MQPLNKQTRSPYALTHPVLPGDSDVSDTSSVLGAKSSCCVFLRSVPLGLFNEMMSISRAICVVVLTVVLSGCGSYTDQTLSTIDTSLLSSKSSDLSRTMDFIFADRQFATKTFQEKVSLGLNRWANYSGQEAELAATDQSPMLKQLLADHQDLALLRHSEKIEFLSTDPFFLQEVFWTSQIANRVVNNFKAYNLFEFYRLLNGNMEIDPDWDTQKVDVFSLIVAKAHPDLEQVQVEKLSKSIKLFDWVVRNIYLLDEISPSESEIESQRLNDAQTPWAAGVRGLGYQRQPWQVLLYSRGDYVDRAKLLLLLLREVEIDAVMLCVGDQENPRPWAVGVAIGDQYYLFDTKLGLGIPGENSGSIATLNMVRENPELLGALDLTIDESLADDSKYWVKSDQLKSLTAMTYVVPESVSNRMAALESSIVGSNRLNLAAFPGKAIKRFPEAQGVDQRLWDIGIKTHWFRDAVSEAIPKAASVDDLADRLQWYFTEEHYIDQFHLYRTNRVRFFKGKFESFEEDRVRNAVESCQVLLYSDDTIDGLATNKDTMRMIGLLSDDSSPIEFENRLKSVQSQMRLVRRDVGLFLSQCLFDNGNPGTSANWLDGIARKDDVDRWKAGVEYLLGRSYESRKEYDLAIEKFQQAGSNQLHGNLIRSRLLKNAVEKAYPNASALGEGESAKANDEKSMKAKLEMGVTEGDPSEKEYPKKEGSIDSEEDSSNHSKPETSEGGDQSSTRIMHPRKTLAENDAANCEKNCDLSLC